MRMLRHTVVWVRLGGGHRLRMQQRQEEEAPAVVPRIRVLRSHRPRKSSILERMEGTTEIETAAAQEQRSRSDVPRRSSSAV